MTYEAGRVLHEIRERLKGQGKWVTWQEEQGLARSTVGNVIALYERVQDIEKIRGLTIMEAYRKYGVLPPKNKEQKALPKSDDGVEEEQKQRMIEGTSSSKSEEWGNVIDVPQPETSKVIDDEAEEAESRAQIIGSSLHLTGPLDSDALRETVLEELSKKTVQAVRDRVLEELEVHRSSGDEVTKLLQIAEESASLPDAVLAEALLKRPMSPDARLEKALDEVTSAATRARSAGLDGPGALWVELLDLIARSALGRLQRAG
jgi:hypothetical protein